MSRTALRALVVTYAGLVVGPVPAVLGGPDLPLLVLGVTAGALLGVAATARTDPVELVWSRRRIVSGFLPPLAWLVAVVATADSLWTLFVRPANVGVVAGLVWLLVPAVATEIRHADRRERAETLATFEARRPADQRRRTKLAAGGVLAVSVVAMAVLMWLDAGDIPSVAWLPALITVWLAALSGDGREVEITDEGLFVRGTLHEWATVEGYSLDDDALRIQRSRWYHSELAFDLADVEDGESVTDALDEFV